MHENFNIKKTELWLQVGNICIIRIPERNEKRGETRNTFKIF